YNAGYFGRNTIVANVEGGHIWGGHEAFDRTGFLLPGSPAISINATSNPVTSPDLGQLDFHATMVGHVLAGTGSTGDGDLTLVGAGMAPFATLWSGAIATTFDQDPDHTGEFEISDESFLLPYKTFFQGQLGQKPDVINSSWGFDDPSGTAKETRILDGLAAANPTVAFVKSAGNGGTDSAPGGPGSGYNGITVGSLGGLTDANPFMRPSDFSSSKPADFFNPETNTTITGVRAAVSIAAPGEELFLAAYLGKSGSLASRADIIGPDGNPATDLYFVNAAGTSFSSPIVAGGVALLKDVSYGGAYLVGQPEARDTRVIKSVLMAGAKATTGWDNGQHDVGGVITTTQALDYATGAGALDLTSSVFIYVDGTTNVPGEGGGTIEGEGWDIGTVALGTGNNYFFDLSFDGHTELTVSLNWFVERVFNDATGDATEQSFANLNLQVWSVTAGLFTNKVAESASLYNNSEFLRLLLPGAGSYGLRVTFDNVAYDLSHTLNSEKYAIAWTTSSVPEPGTWGAAIALALAVLVIQRRRRLPIAHRTR
ncbi:MAG: S8 family serine peptidase, partial [Chthoniobacterales bacterium]